MALGHPARRQRGSPGGVWLKIKAASALLCFDLLSPRVDFFAWRVGQSFLNGLAGDRRHRGLALKAGAALASMSFARLRSVWQVEKNVADYRHGLIKVFLSLS
ncbi:hypothetical protein LAD77_29410 [Klebsiella pneumoniae]|nr:hypothetical protein [Klebsiella pneumoniae]